MKNALFNHKSQAFYISFLFFIPLIFLFFNSANFFKIEFKKQENFTLAIKQFIQNNPNSISPTPINPKTIQAQKPEFKQKPIKKTKKIIDKKVRTIQTKPVPNITPQISKSNETTKEIQSNPTNPTQLDYGKDNHPILEKIQKAIMEQAKKNYPRQARKMRMQGVVKVEFLWKENQNLAELKIIKSSGYDLLDKSALESIRKASAFFPSYESDLRIVLPISYNLS